ncbi:nSTAND1 domain-containing NTPase [Phytohabitans houttuyneae]|uniref:HTH cro/C1-type domain-containing protein n=1 Tax=Phytohabitans houttuyneae TaxID=1076126 RepID=A0A6V8KEH8_9ACTN|nr:helix-turn-helix domain-containing protein [Phytohabitans houttuyneae]GFJ82224.1 hypothetical protein Phou_064040 [Phytohabitans houttuyneae]
MAEDAVAAPGPAGSATEQELLDRLNRLRVAAARRHGKARLSLRDLATATGVPRSSLANYLAGRTVMPLDVLDRVVLALGVDPAQAGAWATAWERVTADRLPAAASAVHPGIPDVCPYRGLEAFTAEHAGWFQGRADAVQRVLAALAGPRRGLLLLGPSGAGKSSLVAAGVLPALAAGGLPGSDLWPTALTRPGPGPGLPARLAEPVDGLLVVDQFEELLTAPDGDREAAHKVLDRLTALIGAQSGRVLLVMRDDFYPRLAALAPELLDALGSGLVNVPATLGVQDLRDIIVEPAADVGLRCQEGLAERIVADVLAADTRTAPARQAPVTVLPLLELTLLQVWRRRRDGWLTHEAYQRAGGVAGSVATWCDAVVDEFPAEQHSIARRMLTALVRPADDVHHIPAVRQQVPLPVLRDLATDGEAAADADAVLAALTAQRVVTTRTVRATNQDFEGTDGVAVAELVHEALIRDWSRLREWVGQDHRFQDWLRRTAEQHARWAASRDPDDLLSGSLLADGLDWSARRRLPADTATFVVASQRRQKAGKRRVRRLTAVLVGLLVAALVATNVAFWQRQNAAASQRVALSRLIAATSDSLIGSDPDLAALLAVRAYRTSPTAEATHSVYAAAALPQYRSLTRHGSAVTAVVLSPDGRTVATGDQDGTVRLTEVATRRSRHVLADRTGAVSSIAFSPDGRTVAVGRVGGPARLWDVATGLTRATLPGGPVGTPSVAFSPDGRTLVTGGDDRVRLWDGATGRLRRVFDRRSEGAFALRFTPDGRTLVAGGRDGDTSRWDIGTGRPRAVAHVDFEDAAAIVYSPDGRLAASSAGGSVRVWDLASGELRTETDEHTAEVSALAFSPDGAALAAATTDGFLRLWNTATWQPRVQLHGHAGIVNSLAFSRDGLTLASAGDDHTARLWKLTLLRPRAVLPSRETASAHGVSFSPDGSTLATTGPPEGAVRFWDPATGRPLASALDGRVDEVLRVSFSPDGRMLALIGLDGGVRLWDSVTGRIASLRGRFIPEMAFSPDGRTLAVGGREDAILLWDSRTGQAKTTLRGDFGQVVSVAFSPDGRTMATGSRQGRATIRDAATGAEKAVLGGHTAQSVSVVYSPDNRTLATFNLDGARLWDVETGRLRAVLARSVNLDSAMTSMAFSPDGRTLATGSGDGTLRLWDVSTTRPRATLTGAPNSMSTVVFSPDGKTIATAGGSEGVQLWSVPIPDAATAVAEICHAIGRNLTRQERITYLPDESRPDDCPRPSNER